MGLDSRDYYRPSGIGGFSFFPPVLKNLIIINVAVFFIQMIFDNISFGGVPGAYIFNRYLALNPLTGIDPVGLPNNFQIWQLLTYQFMHANFTHILFNMFALWMFGMEIENMMGPKKFLTYYLACGLGAGLFQLLLAPLFSSAMAPMGPTIGASGAVFGVMIAFGMLFPDRYIFLYFLIPIKAKYLIAILVIFEFMSVGGQSLIAHFAHIGGAITGLIFILIDRRKSFSRKSLFDNFKKPKANSSFGSTFRKPDVKRSISNNNVEDANFYDINSKTKDEDAITQDVIDQILDKISQSGYQNLTEREKKILFEASKKR
jgi:membrane associated rhomboid family serine protease